jgi:chitodextrinase
VEAGLTVAEYMFALRTEYNYVVAAGKQCFIGTPQPREDFTSGQSATLQVIRDSVLAQFGTHAMDFWHGVVVPNGTARLVIYADPASQYHLNDAGHNVLFHVIQAANIFQGFATSASVITTPNQQNTTVTSLPNGVNKFQVSVQDSHGQFANSVSTLTVSVAGAPTANAGTDQSIVLPTSSVTLDGTASTGTITSRSWTRISGPNSPSFATPTAATCLVTGLIAGNYVFQLSLNGGVSTATVNVSVLPIPACSHNVVMITPDPTDSSYFGTPAVSPGDTIKLNDNGKNFSTIDFEDVHGSQSCPITIKADKTLGRAVRLRGFFAQLKVNNCTYIHITGGGIPGIKYGINQSFENDTAQKWSCTTASGSFFGYAINGRSKNIILDSCYSHHAAIGIEVKQDEDCDTTLNKMGHPNDWIMDSIQIHDMYIKGAWNEGMYIGNTSPDNGPASYDIRPLVCGGVTVYYRPIRIGFVHVWNNTVDSSGRGGIQVASGNGSPIEVDHNTVLHAGMNGDDGQGTGISEGTYTALYCHDNIIRNTLDWNFASLGGGVTNQPIRFINNTIDSAGYLNYYAGAATHVDGACESNLFTIVQNGPGNSFFASFSNAIYAGTRPVDSIPSLDSAQYIISGNKIGKFNDAGGSNAAIHVENGFSPGNFFNNTQTTGSMICNNTALDGITPVLTVQNSSPGSIQVLYTTNCSGPTAPTCDIPIQREIILPNNTALLTGVATPSTGQTISTYSWTQLSGPPATITSPSSSSTTITGLYVNQNSVYNYYTFKLTVVQSDGQSASATIQLLAEIPGIPRHIGRRLIFK